jgi:phosphosulfolactate synthase (CoM biosynthesis protein A)
MFENNGDMSAPIVSNTTSVINQDNASIHITWSGSSPVGEVIVEAQNGDNDDWYVVDFGAPINITGNSGSHILIFELLPMSSIRLQYGYTSGTGTIVARLTSKTVGA